MALCKFCASPGCNKVIPFTKVYCEKHSVVKKRNNKEYDTKFRDKKAKAFYNSKAWKTVRQRVFIMDNYIDLYIYATEKRIVRAEMVHHIIEYKENPGKGLCLDNLISLSAETHEGIIKKMYSNDVKKKEMQGKLQKIVKKYRKSGTVQGV